MITRTGPNRFLVLAIYIALVIVALVIVSWRALPQAPSADGGAGSQIPAQAQAADAS